MLVQEAQLLRWSLPAFALIVGLYWFKRRRIDRADPGGTISTSECQEEQDSTKRESTPITSTPSAPCSAQKSSDSGIHTDDSFDSPKNSLDAIEQILPLRKVSSSMDIPNRKSSASQCASILSHASMELNNSYWNEDDTPVEESIYGSRPSENNGFDLLAKCQLPNGLNNSTGSVIKEEEVISDSDSVKIIVPVGKPEIHEFQDSADKTESQALNKPEEAEKSDKVEPSIEKQTAEDSEKTEAAEATEKAEETEEVKVVEVNENTEETKEADAAEIEEIQRAEDASQNENGAAKTPIIIVTTERDSANHSPVSGALDGSSDANDDIESEGSNDSGRGGSIKENKKSLEKRVFIFQVPLELVGRLIGRGGVFLKEVRRECNVSMVIRQTNNDTEYRMCSLCGTPQQIENALLKIRKYFPLDHYPNFTMEQCLPIDPKKPENCLPCMLLPQMTELSLVEGITNDVVVCHIVAPNHLFLQMPTHPTFPALRSLDQQINKVYNTSEAPAAPKELEPNMVLVAKVNGRWVRVIVVEVNPDNSCRARIVDFGGFAYFQNDELKAMRSDFAALPCQAIEVFLANVVPKNGEWKQEAYDIVSTITSNSIGYAHIAAYMQHYTLVNLYYDFNRQVVISLGDELVARGLADTTPSYVSA
ncbi:A-kinase anchor protein 1, mitochondrial [Trichogramma pretiosum]|uniref:A-kinase anchor protein 1, mitochondrial n=1 Tax=Trichogramma pretiosum TaxID=7493 RepID=UPI0006C9544E|nr:A-kinase anchor protein 1, mitochondrial [Trichogramma pretiosum]XP_014232189.1 A-kinase anchor protein 1, mitochondrial [Trichogramma pretiosum]